MKKLTKVFLLGIMLLFTQIASAEMMKAKTMKDVQTKIDDLLKTYQPEDILVAFDIDMTLTQPDHPAVYYPAIKKYVEVYKAVLGQLLPAQKDLASTLTTQVISQRLVESDSPKIIKEIQQKNIKVIALTSSLASQIKNFPAKMIVLRRDQLQKMGFDFSKSFEHFVMTKEFLEFKKYAGAYPMFYHGILSTNGEGDASKGDVLAAFLRTVGLHEESKPNAPNFRPKVVVMVDDKKKHLENVEKQVKAYDLSIKVVGIEYEGAYTYAPQEISEKEFMKFWEALAEKARKLMK